MFGTVIDQRVALLKGTSSMSVCHSVLCTWETRTLPGVGQSATAMESIERWRVVLIVLEEVDGHLVLQKTFYLIIRIGNLLDHMC